MDTRDFVRFDSSCLSVLGLSVVLASTGLACSDDGRDDVGMTTETGGDGDGDPGDGDGDPGDGDPGDGDGDPGDGDGDPAGDGDGDPGDGDGDPGDGDGDPGSDGVWGVFATGTLVTDDLDMAQAIHDPIAMGGEGPAMMLGDFAHDALTGSGLLGTPTNTFLAIDRWDNLENIGPFYMNPDFLEGFGMLFSDEPVVEIYEQMPDWYSWGDMEAGDGADPYFFAIAKGHLADEPANIKDLHDMVAAGGEEAVMAAGDVAHIVFLGVEDPRDFLAVDIWTSGDAIEAVYSNPDFQAGFAMLFDNQPTISIYQSTDWHQW